MKKKTTTPKTKKEIVEPTVPVAQILSKRRSINEILGFALSKYKTEDVNEYSQLLRLMNKIDLQRECIKVDLFPSDNRELMIERLLKQFRIYIASLQAPPKAEVITVSKRSRDILSEEANSLV